MLPPGPRIPVALQTIEWMARPTAFLRRCAKRHGDLFTVHVSTLGTPMVLASDPDVVRRIFTEWSDVARGGEAITNLKPFVGPRSIIVLDGPEHLRQRRLILPPLHGEKMRAQATLVAELAERELASWPRDRLVPTLPRMRALTLEVITRLVFGARDRAEVEPLRRAIERPLQITSSLPRLIGLARGWRRPWEMFNRAVEVLDEEVARAIARRRADPQEGSVLDLLLAARHEDGTALSDGELRDQLVTLLAAGHETTAGSLAWAFERLARHPAVQQQLREDGDAYLDAVVKEVLRVRPVLSATPRQAAVPYTVGGWTVPAGVHVTPCQYLAHRRPELWPNPTAFRPERFLDGAPEPFAWLPFGGGTRRCAGAAFATMELKAVLGAVASTLDVRPDRPAGERMVRRGVTLMPSRGGRVVVMPR
jgi:cytochrome P450 family 135